MVGPGLRGLDGLIPQKRMLRNMLSCLRLRFTLLWGLQAKEGMACTGFVTKVAPFGLHVSLYGNVFGLLPARDLARHGIHDPSEAFSAGQVRSCPLPCVLPCVCCRISRIIPGVIGLA